MEFENIHAIKNCSGLDKHERVLKRIIAFSKNTTGIVGCFASGSTASGGMDQFSDLDVGLVFDSEESRNSCWETRWDWDIADWLHRFDADHIKDFFVIYFFKPCIKADINLYTQNQLPEPAGAPYSLIWEDKAGLSNWIAESNAAKEKDDNKPFTPSNDELVHQDERFWAWMLYDLGHALRGELYEVTNDYGVMRGIVHKLHSWLQKQKTFEIRKIDTADPDFVKGMSACFPIPERKSIADAMSNLVEIYSKVREQCEREYGISWKSNKDTILEVKNQIDRLRSL